MPSASAEAPRFSKRTVVAWALYDWANSAFATTVMAGLFPVFFKRYWSAEAEVTVSTFRLGVANSVASGVIVILAPLLGAMADAGRLRKRLLVIFCALGIAATAALFLVQQGQWGLALGCFVVGSIGFMGGNVFYDSLLVGIAPESERDRVSALGYSLGYLGGGLLFALNVAMVLWPQAFGLAGPTQATQLAFLSVALWWAVFSIPLIRHVREPRASTVAAGRGTSPGQAMLEGVRQLKRTAGDVRRLRITFLFLLAYWLYIDGVDTIVRMAIDYGMSIGLDHKDLIVALLITQFIGFPAALGFGALGGRIGAKRGVLIGIGVYCLVTVWAASMRSAQEFYALAATVGLVQGGVQALSRSLYARLVPADRVTEFFGFYNMLGKFAAIIGPVLVGSVGILTGSPRASILAVLALFITGGLLLTRIDVEAGAAAARQQEGQGSADGR